MAKVGDFVDELYKNRYEKIINAFYLKYNKYDVRKTDIEDIFQEVILYMLDKEDLDFETEVEVFVYLRRGMYSRISNFISRYVMRYKFISAILSAIECYELGDNEFLNEPYPKHIMEFSEIFTIDTDSIDINKIYSSAYDLLTDYEKTVFELRFSDNLSYDQISCCLNISKRTISKIIKDVVLKLKQEYNEKDK